jgi:hypothetical protein
VAQIVQERGLMRNANTPPGTITCATTGDPARFADLIHRLDLPCDRVERAIITIDA